MKKSLITLITALLVLFVSTSFAEEEKKTYDFFYQNTPVVCGTISEVTRYAEDNKFVPFSLSVGRAGSQPDGQPVFFVTHWVQEVGDEQLVTVMIPDADESCILFRSFDTKLNPDLQDRVKT